MSFILSDQNRKHIAFSLPLIRSRKEPLVEAMEIRLQAARERDEDPGQSAITAMVLVDLLLRQAGHLVETGRLGDLSDTRVLHQAVDIAGRHYSRFGDALVAILTDVLGPTLPREVSAAWCDLFWAVIREVTADTIDA
ncbi:hypothetical protein [Sphingosinicella terrae]|uniref:hypothetical protein n=1 Tax=Sphingosinicella terrae TaxID=2172047 RepID=UPI000E0DE44A|nr:hypothetical protein [Sphingosinicella terrae]